MSASFMRALLVLNKYKIYVDMMTYFFFDKERSDFSLRLLLAEVLDLREESR
jgi:hypothetical protein